jgi:hypothetical protein
MYRLYRRTDEDGGRADDAADSLLPGVADGSVTITRL